VLTDALYPSQLSMTDHAPQLQPLIVLQCPSHTQMDWTHRCGWGRWGSGQKSRIRHSICLRTQSRICGQNPRTDADTIFWDPHTSGQHQPATLTRGLDVYRSIHRQKSVKKLDKSKWEHCTVWLTNSIVLESRSRLCTSVLSWVSAVSSWPACRSVISTVSGDHSSCRPSTSSCSRCSCRYASSTSCLNCTSSSSSHHQSQLSVACKLNSQPAAHQQQVLCHVHTSSHVNSKSKIKKSKKYCIYICSRPNKAEVY